MYYNDCIIEFLKDKNIDFRSFVNISSFSKKENKSYDTAILLGCKLSSKYLEKVKTTKNYVTNMVRNGFVEEDEFRIKEEYTDIIADLLAQYIIDIGYGAYSQSEQNIIDSGFFDEVNKTTPLPHKKIAVKGGLGYIGKNNLLIMPEYGCALSMCSVLTNIPLKTVSCIPKLSKCGSCNVCENVCETNAIKGRLWVPNASREQLIDISKCTTCLMCMAFCPQNQKTITL